MDQFLSYPVVRSVADHEVQDVVEDILYMGAGRFGALAFFAEVIVYRLGQLREAYAQSPCHSLRVLGTYYGQQPVVRVRAFEDELDNEAPVVEKACVYFRPGREIRMGVDYELFQNQHLTLYFCTAFAAKIGKNIVIHRNQS